MILLALAGTLGVVVLLLLPELRPFFERLVPRWLSIWWVESAVVVLLVVHAVARWFEGVEPGDDRTARLTGRVRAWTDSWMDRAWDGGLTIAVGVVCAGFLTTWVPHYLTWPFSRDEDTFAVLALSWDRGILPYRDIRAYNFPGETYLFWGLGQVFGWGRTIPFYAFDAIGVVLLGGILVSWSRRELGGALPGLVGYLAFLGFYLSLPFETTGERDWHTAFLVCSGLMLVQAWPGRWSRAAAALTTALALAIRPHAVLFLPALATAVAQTAPGEGSAPHRRARVVLEWFLWLGAFVALVFAPVLAAGIADDWIRSLVVPAYGGPYSQVTPGRALRAFLDQLRDWKTDVPLAATWLLAIRPGAGLARLARAWALVWLGVLLYRPLHPVQHTYLIHPVLLVRSITWAFVVSWIISLPVPARPWRVVAVALLAYELVPAPPWMCSPAASVRAVEILASGAMPAQPPPGSLQPFPATLESPTRWEAYCAVLDHLRRTTSPRTLVANVLNRYPYESINGPTGRLSPFRAESGICWLSWVAIDLDPEFAQDLRNAADVVVVWEPRQVDVDPAMRLERVVAVIRSDFEPEARFGPVEVWRRRSASPGLKPEQGGGSASQPARSGAERMG